MHNIKCPHSSTKINLKPIGNTGEQSKMGNVKYVVLIPKREKEWRVDSLLLLPCYSLLLLVFAAPNAPFSSLTLSRMALTKVKIPSLLIHSFYFTHFLNSHSKPLNPRKRKPPLLLFSSSVKPHFFSPFFQLVSSSSYPPLPPTTCNSFSPKTSKSSSKYSPPRVTS